MEGSGGSTSERKWGREKEREREAKRERYRVKSAQSQKRSVQRLISEARILMMRSMRREGADQRCLDEVHGRRAAAGARAGLVHGSRASLHGRGSRSTSAGHLRKLSRRRAYAFVATIDPTALAIAARLGLQLGLGITVEVDESAGTAGAGSSAVADLSAALGVARKKNRVDSRWSASETLESADLLAAPSAHVELSAAVASRKDSACSSLISLELLAVTSAHAH